jgi:hypothetical protein
LPSAINQDINTVILFVKGLLTPGAIVAIVIGVVIFVSLFPIGYCAYRIHKKRKAN